MITRYDTAYLALSPVAAPYLAWRWARRRKYRQSGPGMLGRSLPTGEAASQFAGGSVWIHAVSVGEVAAARAVEPHLRSLFPAAPFVISTITETGQEAARRTIPNAEAYTYFPVDFSWNVERFLDAYQPRAIVILETEIWPNFITLAAGRNIPVFLINGKLSDRSFPRYRGVRRFLRPVFESVRGFCVQTSEDERRFRMLGVDPSRIRVTGNCKFDLNPPRLSATERRELRGELGLDETQPVVVAGSTHEGEEELILSAFAETLRVLPNAAMILAPRHPERFEHVAALGIRRGFRVRLASDGPVERSGDSEFSEAAQVVILNKMGALARTYGLGDVAIVAGSFCPVGGHNLLEAAAHEIPVLFGPNMKSQREIAHLFSSAGAGIQVEGSRLAEHLVQLLDHPELRSVEGKKALQVLRSNQGSARRSIDAIAEWLEPYRLHPHEPQTPNSRAVRNTPG